MKSSIAVMTLNSAFLFCLLTILIPVFPSIIPESVLNEVHSFDLATTITILLGCYFLPLWLFLTGFHTMKYVLAIFCGVGLLIVSFIMINLMFTAIMIDFLPVFILTIIIFTTNIMWYVAAFRRIPASAI